MVTFKALLLELLILANYYWYKTQSEEVNYEIAALLSNDLVLQAFGEAVRGVRIINGTYKIHFSAMGELMKENTLQTTDQVCEFVGRSKGFLCALIVSHPPNRTDLPPLSVSFTTAFFDIPTIGISARQSAFSDKNSHQNFLRTITPYSQEARVFINLISRFSWKHINVIYSDNHEGKTLLSLLEKRTEASYQIRAVALKGDQNFTKELHEMSQEQIRVVILYCPTDMAEHVFRVARKLGMFQKDWAWLVTEQALKANNVPPGVLGVRLSQSLEMEHMKDAVDVVKRGVVNALRANIKPFIDRKKKFKKLFLSNCTTNYSHRSKPPGELLLSYLRNVKIYRADKEPLSFDSLGDREQAKYVIINKYLPRDVEQGESDLVEVGRFEARALDASVGDKNNRGDSLEVDLKLIKWPPGNKQYKITKKECKKVGDHRHECQKEMIEKLAAPKSFKKKTHLKVVTKESIPFVYTRPLKKGEKCDTSTDPKKPKKEVECNHTDPVTRKVTQYCCRGYCIDLLRRLANPKSDDSSSEDMENSFSYDLHLVGDNKIGEKVTENGQTRWTGIVEEIYSGMADLGVSPMTITPERATRIEFTKPFKYLGLTILVKRSHPKSNLGSFLQPFANTLWVLVFLSVHVVALVLYLLDRFSPFGRYKFARGADNEEDALNLSSAMWFAWGVLLNSGIGEGTPRSFSARVLGMVWAGFAMIIVASYTANLAAFLVLDRPEALLSGIDDARLRNPQKDFKFATVKGSHVEAYFKSQLEYDTMLRIMTKNVYESAEVAIEAVKSGELKAFIWDSARLEFEAASECDLKTAGEVFGRTGYGLAMRKDSPWIYDISQAVLNFHERGVMETLDSEWILVKAKGCPRTDMSPATLGLTNMAGVFIMVAAGIVAGVFLIFIEMAYKKRTGLKEKELELARNAVDRWRGNVVKRRILRNTMAAERLEKAMPLIGGGGVAPYPYPLAYNNPRYESRQRDCPNRVVQLTNQNGIFAEQSVM